ncbi:MAG: hypothetical protein CR988_07265 [Treponema sp.]|nr:MAG: hypothetical protein CR988_07265 [Treponema sp.]
MSICPDKIIYSEYLDDELPSPWKEKMEKHIKECADCDSTLKKFTMISEAMHSDDVSENFDSDASYERLKVKFKQGYTTYIPETRSQSFWKSSIKLPLPAIAAAVLAVVLLPTVFFVSKNQNIGKQQFFAQNYPPFFPSSQAGYNVSETSNPAMNTGGFSSSIREFTNMYMPSSNESEDIIIIKIPSSKLNTLNGNIDLKSLLSDEQTSITTKEPSE